MGFFQGLGDAFGFGDAGAGDATNQINLANLNAAQTQSQSFRQSEQGFQDILRGRGTGEVDARSDAERALELLISEGTPGGPGTTIDQIQRFIAAGEPADLSPFGGEAFRSILGSTVGRLLPRQRERPQGGGLEGRVNRFGELEGRQLANVEQAASIGGFDQRLGEIFGSQNFQNLQDERLRAVQGQLAAGGLTRSGTALQEIANVPTQLGFDIENQQFNRQQGLAGLAGNQFNTGLNQQINLQTNLENFRRGLGGQLSNLQQQTGQAESSGILAGRQAQAAGIGNLASLAGGIATGGLSTIGQGATGFTGALGRFGRSFQQ